MRDSDSMLYYLVREPGVKADKPPLVILLHGVGSNEQDLFSFADHFPKEFLVVSARAPYTIGQNRYAWFQVEFSEGKPIINKEQAEQSRVLLLRFVGQLKKQHAFDDQRVYLCGFSQGGIMSYSVGLSHPEIVKGIAVMSGRLLDEVKPLIASTEKLKHLNIFISHGKNDPVLNIQYARDALNYLEKLSIHPAYKEYNEVHTINQEMLHDLLAWINRG